MNTLKQYIGNMEKPQGADDFLANMATFFGLFSATELLANPDMMEAVTQFLLDIPHYGLKYATDNFLELIMAEGIDMNPCELCGDYYPERMMSEDSAYCQSCVEDMEWD